MSKTYEIAPQEVAQRALALIEHHYHDLANAGVTIEYLFCRSEAGHPVQSHGYPALAVVRIVNLRDRAKNSKDAEITIDAEKYEDMSDGQKNALLDHELNHLIVLRTELNEFQFDDLNRPRLKLRKHDYQFGWFTEIALRHGADSPEVFQAKVLWQRDGQAYFPLLTDAKK